MANNILDQLVIKALTMDVHRSKDATSARAISINRIQALQANVDMGIEVKKARDIQAAERASIQGRKEKMERAYNAQLKRLESETQMAELQAESVNLAAQMMRAKSDDNAESQQLLKQVEKEKQQEMEKVEKEKQQEMERKAKQEVRQKMKDKCAVVEERMKKRLKDKEEASRNSAPPTTPKTVPKPTTEGPWRKTSNKNQEEKEEDDDSWGEWGVETSKRRRKVNGKNGPPGKDRGWNSAYRAQNIWRSQNSHCSYSKHAAAKYASGDARGQGETRCS